MSLFWRGWPFSPGYLRKFENGFERPAKGNCPQKTPAAHAHTPLFRQVSESLGDLKAELGS